MRKICMTVLLALLCHPVLATTATPSAGAERPTVRVVPRQDPQVTKSDNEAPSIPARVQEPVRVPIRPSPDAVQVRPGSSTTTRSRAEAADAPASSSITLMSPAACEQFRVTANTHRARILSHLDVTLAGTEHLIDTGSTLLMQRIDDIEFRGCEVRVSARVAILQSGRPDRTGSARLHGRVNHHDPARSEFCFAERPNLEAVNVDGGRGINDVRMGAALQRVRPVHRCVNWR